MTFIIVSCVFFFLFIVSLIAIWTPCIASYIIEAKNKQLKETIEQLEKEKKNLEDKINAYRANIEELNR